MAGTEECLCADGSSSCLSGSARLRRFARRAPPSSLARKGQDVFHGPRKRRDLHKMLQRRMVTLAVAAAAGLSAGVAMAVAPVSQWHAGAVCVQPPTAPTPVCTPAVPPVPCLNMVNGNCSPLPVSDALEFEGFTNTNESLLPPGCVWDGDRGVDIEGGCGGFAFQSAACVAASDPVEVPPESVTNELGLCSVNGSGTFESDVCGTGFATGSGALAGPEPGNVLVEIWFYAFVGVLEGIWNDATENSHEPLLGLVAIGPNPNEPPPDLVDDCANGFAFAAADVVNDTTIPTQAPQTRHVRAARGTQFVPLALGEHPPAYVLAKGEVVVTKASAELKSPRL